MAEWRHEIETFEPVIEALDDGHIGYADAGAAIFNILSDHPLYEADEDFEQIADEIGWLDDTDSMSYFDGCLEDLYDWADANRVWISPTKGL